MSVMLVRQRLHDSFKLWCWFFDLTILYILQREKEKEKRQTDPSTSYPDVVEGAFVGDIIEQEES